MHFKSRMCIWKCIWDSWKKLCRINLQWYISYQAINKVLLHISKGRDMGGMLREQLNLTEDIENVNVGAYVDSRPFIIIILRASTSAWLRLKSDLSVVHGISASTTFDFQRKKFVENSLASATVNYMLSLYPPSFSLAIAFHRLTVEFYPPSLSGPLSPTLHSSFLSATIIDSLLFRHGRFQ